jgi:hypothetical protein
MLAMLASTLLDLHKGPGLVVLFNALLSILSGRWMCSSCLLSAA